MIPSRNQSRMFRTIVVMGSGLALSCGGKAREDGQASAGGSSGSAAAGSPSGASGSGNANGGSSSAGSSNGGTLNIGGMLGIGGSPAGGAPTVGGATSVGGAGGTPACPPAEWTCSGPSDCGYETGWQPNSCKCDASHPKTSADCKLGQAFVCLSTGESASAPRHGFDCHCVPSSSYCSAECASAYSNLAGSSLSCDDQTVPNTVLCGCAVVILK